MRIGIIVDGRAEFSSMNMLIPRIRTNAEAILNPIRCDIQPYSTAGQIANVVVKTGLGILLYKRADKVVVVIDKENRVDCTIEFVRSIEDEIARRKTGAFDSLQVKVVLKTTTYENWLIADPNALNQLPALISHPERIRRQVSNNRADNLDAQRLLSNSIEAGYDKVRHAQAICAHFDPDLAAQNSRSFRKFLQLLEHPNYLAQTKNPFRAET